MPQNTMGKHFNTPYYLPNFPWKRRRYATTVLAGHFDKSNVADFWRTPPLEERSQNVSGAMPVVQSNQGGTNLLGPTNGASGTDGTLAGRREAAGRGTAASSSTRTSQSSAPRSRASNATNPSAPKSSNSHRKNDQLRTTSSVAQPNAPKTKSNLHHVYSPAPQPAPRTIYNTTPIVGTSKRPATTESGGDARPAKKHRPSAPTQHPESSSTTAEITDELSSPIFPGLTISLPELTRAGTTIDDSSPSPDTLRHNLYMSLSPAPSSSSSVQAGVLGVGNGSKRTKVKKGWKGWIEVDPDVLPEPPSLIKIDEPVVLEKTRQTRSGRKFADVNKAAGIWEDDLEGQEHSFDSRQRSDTPLTDSD